MSAKFLDSIVTSNDIDDCIRLNSADDNHFSSSTTSSSKYFTTDKYEYEISPEHSTSSDSQASTGTHIITETSLPMSKTVYLIRHAESDENRRKECLKTSVQGLGKLRLPKREDVVASIELMNLRAQLDSNVSPKGQAQIDQLGKRIAQDDFVRKMGIELVAHSPLQRARQTSFGMLQCVAPASIPNGYKGGNYDNNHDPTINGCKHSAVKRVVELDILSERTPIEWLPIQHDAFTRRIAEFEMWLSQQPEDVIAIVGHSLYFKNMLGMESKFQNVDVWSLEFDFTVENSVQKVRQDVLSANEIETKKKIQKHIEKLGNFIPKMVTMKNRNDFASSSSSSTSDMKEDNEHTNNPNDEGIDNRDEDDTSATSSQNEIQTGIDGVILEDLELPRGWRQLKLHYRFDPNYLDQ